jgi:hypothetical protein
VVLNKNSMTSQYCDVGKNNVIKKLKKGVVSLDTLRSENDGANVVTILHHSGWSVWVHQTSHAVADHTPCLHRVSDSTWGEHKDTVRLDCCVVNTADSLTRGQDSGHDIWSEVTALGRDLAAQRHWTDVQFLSQRWPITAAAEAAYYWAERAGCQQSRLMALADKVKAARAYDSAMKMAYIPLWRAGKGQTLFSTWGAL